MTPPSPDPSPTRSEKTPPRSRPYRPRDPQARAIDSPPSRPIDRETRRFLQAVRGLSGRSTSDDILRVLVRWGIRLTGATAGAAGRFNGQRIVLSEFQRGAFGRSAEPPRPLGPCVGASIIAARKPYLCNDPARDRHLRREPSRAVGVYNLVYVPILSRTRRLLGCLELYNTKDARAFDEDDLRLLRGLADTAATALGAAQASAECRQHALEARETQGHLEAVLSGSQDGILLVDAEGRLESGNQAAFQILGWPKGTLIGLPLFRLVPSDRQASVRERWEQLRASPSGRWDLEMIRKDGERRNLLVSHRSTRIGGAEKHCLIIRDLSDRLRADAALLQERERARSYLQIAAVMIVAIDPSQRVTLANRRTCEILGYEESEVVGRNWFDCFVPERERRRVKAAFVLLMRGELEPSEHFENPVLARDGTERLIAWHNTLLRDSRNRIVGTLSSGTDITDRKKSEDALRTLTETLEHRVAERTAVAEERARRLRALAQELTQVELRERRRVAHVLHEHFQQLLAAARMHLGLVTQRSLDPKQKELVRTVEAILRQSMEEARTLAVELCPPVLYELGLGPALDWLGTRMLEKHRLRVTIDDLSGQEPDDLNLRAFLFEAVRELLYNVAKHASVASAQVTVRRKDADTLCIVVADEGIGFAPERVRIEESNSGGFGLFSIRERLASMGGRAEVESAPGRGTRVSLSVPLRP